MGNIVVLLVLSIVVFLVVRSMWINRKKTQCNGDCTSCSGGCHHDWEAIRREIKMNKQAE